MDPWKIYLRLRRRMLIWLWRRHVRLYCYHDFCETCDTAHAEIFVCDYLLNTIPKAKVIRGA